MRGSASCWNTHDAASRYVSETGRAAINPPVALLFVLCQRGGDEGERRREIMEYFMLSPHLEAF